MADGTRTQSTAVDNPEGHEVNSHEVTGSEVVINELLTNCTHHLNNSSVDAVNNVISKFYADEIVHAKQQLWNSCGEDLLGVWPKRITTNVCGSHVKHLDDIIDGLRKLDAVVELCDRPVFVAAKLDRLPRYGPEELNLTSVVMQLNNLERHYTQLDGKLAQCTDSIAAVLDAQCSMNSYSGAAQHGNQRSNTANSTPQQ